MDLVSQESPFVTPGFDVDQIVELPSERRVDVKEEAEKVFNEYQEFCRDHKKIMNRILEIYRFIVTPEEKQNWEKNQQDVMMDILRSNYTIDVNLEKFIKEHSKSILNSQINTREQAVAKKTTLVSALFDLAYVYFSRYCDENAPLYNLPRGIRFDLITNVLKRCAASDSELVDQIIATFKEINDNETLTDMRNDQPPYHLRTTLNTDEIKEQLETIVKPAGSKLIGMLLKLRAGSVNQTDEQKNPAVDINAVD